MIKAGDIVIVKYDAFFQFRIATVSEVSEKLYYFKDHPLYNFQDKHLCCKMDKLKISIKLKI